MKKTDYILMSLIHSSFNQITHFKTVANLLFYLDEHLTWSQRVTSSTFYQGSGHRNMAAQKVRDGAKSASNPDAWWSAWLEEEDGNLTEIEVNEVLGLMGNVWTEVPAHDAMPGGVVLLVKLLKHKKTQEVSVIMSQFSTYLRLVFCALWKKLKAKITQMF